MKAGPVQFSVFLICVGLNELNDLYSSSFAHLKK